MDTEEERDVSDEFDCRSQVFMTDSLCDLHLQRASINADPTRACRPGPQLKPPETWPWASLTRKFSSVVSAKPLCVSARDRKLSSE